MRYILTTAIMVAILPAAAAYSQTALNSQTNESPIAALSSVLNYDAGTAGTVAGNTHDVTAYGNAITNDPAAYFTLAIDSVQINRAAIEARASSVSYAGQTVQDNHLRAMAYGNLAVLGATESILSQQTTTAATSGGVTATTSDVQVGVSITDGTAPGTIDVSGNSVTSSAVGNSSSYTITN